MFILFSRKIGFTLPRNIRILIVLNTDPQKYFHIAVKSGNLHTIKYLVSIGADITVGDNYAVRLADENGHEEVVEYLKSLIQN
jgi:ankyrin repeat protein